MTRLVVLYSLFAVLATLANLAVQRAVLALAGDAAVGFALAVICGTGAGLVLKYILDKRWIFDDRSAGLAAHGRKFGLYTLMGVATTAIFWGAETAFWLIWGTDLMRELGAVLGLAVGYVVKYRLDRRFVFAQGGQAA
ncbi:GtrA family protein [Pseudooceanicola aestuarii]|uniref:GtrA family protein n=1 Tax=Pseudooceanicola aestuarii TaxID=2697319 RepID=UPI0019531ADC|nr:GtrA family protein [Pseudooceanicola aestuarii]